MIATRDYIYAHRKEAAAYPFGYSKATNFVIRYVPHEQQFGPRCWTEPQAESELLLVLLHVLVPFSALGSYYIALLH